MYGIPKFRLDKNLVKESINFAINNHNINVKLNSTFISKAEKPTGNNNEFFTVEDLKNDGYKHIFIAIGKEESVMLDIEGINEDGVFKANDVLRMNKEEAISRFLDKDVVVIGGGNVAIDSSRFALKIGNAKSSKIIYRRKRENMKANLSEILEAEKENVIMDFEKNVIKILKVRDDKNITSKLELELDDGTKIKTDILILAIGSKLNEKYFDDEFARDEYGNIKVDENNESNVPQIFFGGDIINKNQTVAEAIKTGREVAMQIYKKERLGS